MQRFNELQQLLAKLQLAYVNAECGEDLEEDTEIILGIDLDDALARIKEELNTLAEIEEA